LAPQDAWKEADASIHLRLMLQQTSAFIYSSKDVP
jgi:hypothetical protein